MPVITYRSNNSGGDWWLKDEDWLRLEAAGWKVSWAKDSEFLSGARKRDRWLGALAVAASKEFGTREEAIEEWASVTGKDPHALGCECCGRPHEFYPNWDD